MNIMLYGPPGVGKTTVGALLASRLGWDFVDSDVEISHESGLSIEAIFELEGEEGFRRREKEMLIKLSSGTRKVISLGGGSLLDPENRKILENNGKIINLDAQPDVILERLTDSSTKRPLLAGDDPAEKLRALLEKRAQIYSSIPNQVSTDGVKPKQVVEKVMLTAGVFHIIGMGHGYDVVSSPGCLKFLPRDLSALSLFEPFAILVDSNVAKFHLQPLKNLLEENNLACFEVILPAGEENKNLRTVEDLYSGLVKNGMDRSGTILALGGGVTGDVAGFTAATFMRGVKWVCLPTSLLAMVDSSIGGKTGVDLPAGKNLAGAFYAPSLVLTDPQLLSTLPKEILRDGLAEVIKNAFVGDAHLVTLLEQQCPRGLDDLEDERLLDEIIRRAIHVKTVVVMEDPYEKGGVRQALNFGHTIAHALETWSHYGITHGQAVAAGMVAETKLAEKIGLCEKGLSTRLTALLQRFGLPTHYPIPVEEIIRLSSSDKKRRKGKIRWALPQTAGIVQVNIEVGEEVIKKVFS